ncbi:MAG: hypothetical protein E3J90_09720 [Promethearchaeota archaeon]|nr:MAG: hypothetical protein E3J90_09720 [Candidatus Lokiarchaeota archaeon]
MFNEDLEKNRLNILNFNSKVSIVENPGKLDEKVRIPLTPIQIDAFLLYNLYAVLYPRFISEQQNNLDIIVSDFDIDNIVFGVYLYKTNKPGVHETVEILPNDLVVIKQENLDDINKLFNKFQSPILKNHGVKINNIRIIKKRGLDLINSHYRKISNSTNSDILRSFLDLMQISLDSNLIAMYPEPYIFKFLRNNIGLLEGIRLSSIFAFIEDLIPSFNVSVVMTSNQLSFGINLKKIESYKMNSDIEVKLHPIEREDYDLNSYGLLTDIKIAQQTFMVDNVFNINFSVILEFLSELFENEIPFDKEILRLFFQKFLYGIRSFDLHWSMYPKPKTFSPLIRFLIRLLGIDLNLQKLSHWAIPDYIFGLFDTFVGLNAKILLILTSNKKDKDFNNQTPITVLLEIENGTLTKVKNVTEKELLSGIDHESLDSIRFAYSERFGFITNIIIVNKNLIKTILNTFIFKFHKISWFSILKVLKMMKKPQNFQIYPEIPPYSLLKKKNSFFFMKDLLKIAIDKHNF